MVHLQCQYQQGAQLATFRLINGGGFQRTIRRRVGDKTRPACGEKAVNSTAACLYLTRT